MNKNKVSVKTIIIIIILILVGVLGVLGINTAKTYLSGASSDMAPKNVLAKPSDDGKMVTITWVSDKPSMGVLEYGTTPASLLLRAPESEQRVSHTASLFSLKANTNYYFRIRVGEDVFDNNGIPYSFKTKIGVVPTVVPTVSLLPTVIPTIPNGEVTTCNRTTDYNKDGIINSLDYMSCLKNKPTGTATIPSPATISTVPGSTTTVCPSGVDYNKDGVINSLDRLKCLQEKK